MEKGQHSASLLFFILIAALSTGVHSVEYCDWETFNVTCPANQVIAIVSARYGRMNLGRCVSVNYGSIGCGADATSHLEAACSGNRACAVSVISLSQVSLPTSAPCPADFKYYLEADYECLKVYSHINGSAPSCPASGASLPSPVLLSGSSEGLLASAVTMETGMGGPSCPWLIRVEPYQRINITLLDFSVPLPPYRTPQQFGGGSGKAGYGGHQYRASATGWEYGDASPGGGIGPGAWAGSTTSCDEYALISEDVEDLSGTSKSGRPARQRRNVTVCGRRRRQVIVFVSETNVVEIRFNLSTSRLYKFVLKYEAFGCPPFEPPPGAWTTNAGRHIFVQCNDSATGADEELTRWRLTCRGTSWHGHVGNCSGSGGPSSLQVSSFNKQDDGWAIGEMFGGNTNFPFGILFVIALGVLIGVIAGVLMLLGVLAYMRQRKLRKVRGRSNYVIHEPETTTGSGHSYDSKVDNSGNSYATRGRPTQIYRPFCPDMQCDLATWQRTRPLPVPSRLTTGSRGSLDDEDDDDENVIAMTPLTSTSEQPLLTPSGDRDGFRHDGDLFNIITSSGDSDAVLKLQPPPDAVRNFAAASHWHSNDALTGSSCHPQHQPIDAARLLLMEAACRGGSTDTAALMTSSGPRAGAYEHCIRERTMQTPVAGAPYYFKLDLTAGVNGAGGAGAGSDEHAAGSQCLVCLHQQRTGTLQRKTSRDQSRATLMCSGQQQSADLRF